MSAAIKSIVQKQVKKVSKVQRKVNPFDAFSFDAFPPDTLANDSDLKLLNITPESLDPSGKYLIIVKATELKYPYVRKIGPDFYKWAIAPQGYYYYWNDQFGCYDMCCIPK